MDFNIVFADNCKSLIDYIKDWGYRNGVKNIIYFETLRSVREYLSENQISRIIVDMVFDNESDDGLRVLEYARRKYPNAECILITGKPIDVSSINRLAMINGVLIKKEILNWDIIRSLLSQVPFDKTAILKYPEIPDVGELALRANNQGSVFIRKEPIRIIHISDMHIDSMNMANKYCIQLTTDLSRELGIDRLDYFIISGDIGNKSIASEYDAAMAFISCISERFKIGNDRIIVVPGNHDLNWRLSRQAYRYEYHDDIVIRQEERECIPAGDDGVLVRDPDSYCGRFQNFGLYCYEKINREPYPMNPGEQGILHMYRDDGVIILGLNSAWDIDHYYRNRASINMDALSKCLIKLQGLRSDKYLRIVVFHHPINGNEAMNNEFLELLVVHGFQILLHGHIHEAIEGYHKYDADRGIHIVGAGTFGARTSDRAASIPLQYNLITCDIRKAEFTVETRKREKSDGAWSADARWVSKNNPKPRYTRKLKRLMTA